MAVAVLLIQRLGCVTEVAHEGGLAVAAGTEHTVGISHLSVVFSEGLNEGESYDVGFRSVACIALAGQRPCCARDHHTVGGAPSLSCSVGTVDAWAHM